MQEKFFEALNDLTEKVQFLYIERKKQGAQQAQAIKIQNIECDNPHEKVRAPMVKIESYPRLIETTPSLETDFFRSLMPEGKKKFIYECPKFLGMNITLPPLNEEATSAVQKNDAAFYGIQMALANITKPIEYLNEYYFASA
ncbi:hypothetical protein BB561_003943 [Smittium simulii]|uniref:Uncharacterized protein n=1 Tax=Smittium simulii TaxID=133385 RepID=A0A2T9YIX3_9FUNG|nr:hypothetical protein BB561_003943 [Smittium simulii]